MRTISAVLMMCLVGCAAQTMRETMRPVELTAEQTTQVQDGVRRSLKDPESARFGPMQAATNEAGDISVCGLVNGRNSYGGYTGEQPFIGGFASRAFHVTAIGGSFAETMAVKDVCRDKGLNLDRAP